MGILYPDGVAKSPIFFKKMFSTRLQTPVIYQKTSRLIAIETLHQLQLSSAPLPVLFHKISAEQNLSSSDRALAMNLVFGVLRQKQYLDILISKLCRHPIKKLHPLVHQALAVGLYQLFFLSRIPESAAVNETVKAVKITKVPKRLHGFVNGVLRQSIRERMKLPQPDAPDNKGEPILNHPEWLTRRWQSHFGRKEMEAICKQNNKQQPLTLRVNTVKTTKKDFLSRLEHHNISAKPGKYAPDGIVVRDYHGQITSIPGYDQGLFQVQDEAAQLVTLLLQPFQDKGHYLDGCSGLGGKTGHILQLIDGTQATLIAIEPEFHRQEKQLSNLQRLFPGKEYFLFRDSLQQFCKTATLKFNSILVDAPCSGTGVTGRHPDIRWRRRPTDILNYAKTQLELIHHAASLLLPGGILVYATCSLEPEENRGVIKQFLNENSEMSLTDCSAFLPLTAAPLIQDRCFHAHPTHSLDGFFAARLVRSLNDD